MITIIRKERDPLGTQAECVVTLDLDSLAWLEQKRRKLLYDNVEQAIRWCVVHAQGEEALENAQNTSIVS